MAAPESPRPSSMRGILCTALEKLVKNASWRKHGKLVQDCKTVLEKLAAFVPSEGAESPLFDDGKRISANDAEFILQPLLAACDLQAPKVIEPALDCFQKLIVYGHLVGEIGTGNDSQSESSLILRIVDAVCKCQDLGDEGVELVVLKTLLTTVVSTSLSIHGDHLLKAISTCYNMFLESKVIENQTTAKATLTQMLVVIFKRMEADSASVPLQPVVVADLLEDEKPSSDTFVQSFITKVVQDIDVVLHASGKPVQHDDSFAKASAESSNTDILDSSDKDTINAKHWEVSMYKNALETRKSVLEQDTEVDKELDAEFGNKFKRDAYLVFKALCKLSMKTPPQEGTPEHVVRAKVLALELLKIVLENAGPFFCTNARFLSAIKQYLCLSLLQNCASSHMLSVFQISCSIFLSFIAKFRASLKAEIGVFFPMIILRVIENVAQPNYQQKMTVLCFIEKLSDDPQILADTFVNYDCDVESSNIFERVVNGLLKSAQGAPPGSDTGLTAAQDATLKLTAMKCLVGVLKSMGDWMDKQIRATNSPYLKSSDIETKIESPRVRHEPGEEASEGVEGHVESASETSTENAVTFEQRRVHKLELRVMRNHNLVDYKIRPGMHDCQEGIQLQGCYNMQEGIALFNQKPRKGIDYLVKAKKVEKTPEEVAKFLLTATGLNKGMIGDYLGEKEEFSLKVMHAYVDSFKFQNMDFDEAIRAFLMGFRLPGEAQKIDRIMEKFAERFCICNPKAFTSADTAYVLAYSVIMLNTDAHNAMVKDKMSKADFIKNNRGIDDGKDLPEEFMSGLYDRIVQKEIKMKVDTVLPVNKNASKENKFPAGIDNILNIVIRKPKEESHLFESSENAIRYMQEQLKEKAQKPESVYYAATDVEILKPMVEVSWAPMLAGFSVPLDKSDEEVVTLPCLEGFKHAIHITAVLSMQTQRDAFVTSLAKFTSLHSPVDIKQKNVNAIKVMLSVAEDDGNYLQEAWEHMLTCISRFEQLHLIGEGALPDATFFSNEPDKSKLSNSHPKKKGRLHFAALATRRGSYDSTGARPTPLPGAVSPEQMSNLVSHLSLLSEIDTTEMNKIFTRSQSLSGDAIVDFVKALCKVSMDELRSPTDPRVFSLTKIVEISHFNMNRIRLVWNRMWNTLSDFFVAVGCSSNFSVAMYAMDSLRQLAMKFMDREELANYNFQNQFMRPFVVIMQRSGSVEIREFIIRCFSQMVFTRVSHVKSGWKITFMIFTIAATDENEGIVHLAFETVEKVVREYFQYITETETTIFTDCVNCLLAFIKNRFNEDISLNAIAFLRFCALKLGEGELGTSVDNNTTASTAAPKAESNPDKDDHLFFWSPLLAGLTELSFDSRPAIRKSAVHILFDVLQCHGHLFSTSSWEQVYDAVLFPLFDYARRSIKLHDIDSEEEDAWVYETCTLALQFLVDLFVQFFGVVCPFIRRILALLTGLLKRHHEKIAAITMACFVRFVVKAGPQFSKDHWVEVLQGLQAVSMETFPNAMQIVVFVESESRASTGKEFTSEEANKCQMLIYELKYHTTVQMLVVQAVREIYDAYGSKMAPAYIMLLLDILNRIVGHAHQVNSDLSLRNKIQELQLTTQMSDPPLLRLESDSSHAYMEILQRLHVDNPGILKNADVETRFVEFCEDVLKVYLETSTSTHQPKQFKPLWVIPVTSARKTELAARAPLVVMTLKAVTRFKDTSFQRYLTRFFPVLTSLVGCEHGSVEVQVALSDVFGNCIGPLFIK